ncbi:MAG: SUMF1/EgtB/PvdO family nonheme iron enzyme, partial [Anaerolineae bacterium]|nr:SUMF1/EgtB/PvdO family nonheme iron enzyme [Anaerolineae bacterium]
PFEWCVVPAGKVTLEPHGYRTGYLKFPLTFEVPEFEISRFPITNAQFDAFVSSEDGWCDRSWWDFSQNAKIWREENDTPAPGRLAECGNCPRTNLSWYSAIAFALWLSAKTGEDVMLPNEQQWQRAAQGDDGRIYPWGDKWDGNLCNHSVAPYTSQNTSTVTHYYEGASPFGVLDMSGNVWEWCLTDINTGNVQLAGANFRVLRGGAFYVNDLEYIQTTVRNGNIPSSQNEVSGFRLVRFS